MVVDLRKCKAGDVLVSKSGKRLTYIGPTDKDHYNDHYVKYSDKNLGFGTRTHDGFVFRKNRRDDDEDIIEVIPKKIVGEIK